LESFGVGVLVCCAKKTGVGGYWEGVVEFERIEVGVWNSVTRLEGDLGGSGRKGVEIERENNSRHGIGLNIVRMDYPPRKQVLIPDD